MSVSFANSVTRKILPWALLPLAACAPARMATPSGLADRSEAMSVDKEHAFLFLKLRKMTFGPYQVTDLRRGWASRFGAGVGDFSGSEISGAVMRQKYQFTLTPAEGPRWFGRCGVRASEVGVSTPLLGGTLAVDLDRQSSLACSFRRENGSLASDNWDLNLALHDYKAFAEPDLLKGKLGNGSSQFEVEGTSKVEGARLGAGEATGYVIRRDGQAIGAVQIMNRGKVWMDTSAAPEVRSPLALASTALLLHRDLLDDDEIR